MWTSENLLRPKFAEQLQREAGVHPSKPGEGAFDLGRLPTVRVWLQRITA
jgi:hypothetical protein